MIEIDASFGEGGAIDAWLADQLLLPLAFVPERSEISVCRISRHLHSNAELLGYFLPVAVDLDGEIGEPGTVRIQGIADRG